MFDIKQIQTVETTGNGNAYIWIDLNNSIEILGTINHEWEYEDDKEDMIFIFGIDRNNKIIRVCFYSEFEGTIDYLNITDEETKQLEDLIDLNISRCSICNDAYETGRTFTQFCEEHVIDNLFNIDDGDIDYCAINEQRVNQFRKLILKERLQELLKATTLDTDLTSDELLDIIYKIGKDDYLD